MTHENQVSFEQAKMLKELGYNWETPYYYYKSSNNLTLGGYIDHNQSEDFISSPSMAVASKWLREVKGYHIGVEPEGNKWGYVIYELDKESGTYDVMYVDEADDDEFDTYEEALGDALDMILGLLMEMLKQGKK